MLWRWKQPPERQLVGNLSPRIFRHRLVVLSLRLRLRLSLSLPLT